MTLFDSSVWIDFGRDIQTPQTDFLAEALPKGEVATCPTIIQEVLQGIREERLFRLLHDRLLLMNVLVLDPTESAVEAAQLYRSLRKKGLTIRKPNDCLIAVHAMRHQMELCHADSDFDLIAAHSDLRLVSLPR